MMYNVYKWYWRAEDGRVYSSADQATVTVDDQGFQAFVNAGGMPTRWPRDLAGNQTSAALLEVVGPFGLVLTAKEGLLNYAASKRYDRETSGTTVNGVAMPTDRQTQAQLTGAYLAATQNSSISISWKLGDGTFATLSAAQIIATALAVSAFVQSAFALEASVVSQINSNAITTKAQIDAAFA